MNKGKRIKKIRRIVTLAFIACVMSTCSVFSLGTSASIVAPKSVTKQVNAQLNIAPEASYSKGFKLKWNRVKTINGKKVIGYGINYADKKDSKSSYG